MITIDCSKKEVEESKVCCRCKSAAGSEGRIGCSVLAWPVATMVDRSGLGTGRHGPSSSFTAMACLKFDSV